MNCIAIFKNKNTAFLYHTHTSQEYNDRINFSGSINSKYIFCFPVRAKNLKMRDVHFPSLDISPLRS